MNKKLLIPAWLLAAAIFAQLLMVVLSGHLIWKQTHPAPSWHLDSTTYYKTLDGQGNLNLRLYEQLQQHNERLRTVESTRKARHRHIDSLSGPVLQSEIDRLYNGGRQSEPARPQTDSTHRSGRAAGPQGSGRFGDVSGHRRLSGYAAGPAEAGHCCPIPDDYPAQPASAGGHRLGQGATGAGRPVPKEAARSPVGELAGAGGRRSVPGRQVETYLTYWRLIRQRGFTYPDVAFAISAVETGYWHDLPGNNLFGMKKNSRGFYESISAGGYCRYANQQASLSDYHAYEQQVIARYRLRCRADYLTHINRRFCPNPRYAGKLDLAFQTLQKLSRLT